MKNRPPTGLLLKRGPTTMIRSNTMTHSVSRRDHERTDIVHDAAGPPADVFERDGQRQAGIDVERRFGDVAFTGW